MNNLPNNNDDLTQQTTTDLFDPFAPTTTTTGMFDEVFVDSKDADIKEFKMRPNFVPSNTSSSTPQQTLANYNFDDLWNQSMSHIVPSNNNNTVDSNTFSWDAFLNNNNENLNPFNDDKIINTNLNLTWESLFNEDNDEKEKQQQQENETDLKDFLHWIINHLNDPEKIQSQPIITFTSIHNLESIIKDIHMSTMPFEPIPSPPLHVDHTVANPLINAIHHELFPIDELEQPNINQGQQSMILYEEDEEEAAAAAAEEENNNNKLSPFDIQVKPIVEQLVSNILQLAIVQINQSYEPIEHFVDQILSQAIYEIYYEDENLSKIETNNIISTDNLASIISWHDQTNKQLLDPFDKKFDSVWSSHFQAPDDNNIINENLFTNENKIPIEPILSFSKNFDEQDLFSSTSNSINKIQETEDDETSTFSEYIPPTLLTNPANVPTATNNLMKYTLTAPVMDDSGDDSSFLEDYLTPRKNESSVVKIDEESTKNKDNLFSNDTKFEIFASNQPLNSLETKSEFEKITDDNNSTWTTIEKPSEINQSNDINDDSEPWELEDSNEEKITPVPTTTRLSTAFNDDEFLSKEKSDSYNNFFSDSFNPSITSDKQLNNHEENEQILTKTVRFDDNVQNIRLPTPPPQISLDMSESSSTTSNNDEDEIQIDDITPTLETSYININETDIKTENSDESVELTPATLPIQPENEITIIENENIPSNISNDIEFKPNTDAQYKINLRSESEITPTIDTTIRNNPEPQLNRSIDSG